jgi:hypothetical protein
LIAPHMALLHWRPARGHIVVIRRRRCSCDV